MIWMRKIVVPGKVKLIHFLTFLPPLISLCIGRYYSKLSETINLYLWRRESEQLKR